MLEEIQLLVLGGGPEVLPFVCLILLLQIPLFVDNGNAALLPEGRVGQHHRKPFPWVAAKAVRARCDRTRICADPV